jgi:hypothetical protein
MKSRPLRRDFFLPQIHRVKTDELNSKNRNKNKKTIHLSRSDFQFLRIYINKRRIPGNRSIWSDLKNSIVERSISFMQRAVHPKFVVLM